MPLALASRCFFFFSFFVEDEQELVGEAVACLSGWLRECRAVGVYAVQNFNGIWEDEGWEDGIMGNLSEVGWAYLPGGFRGPLYHQGCRQNKICPLRCDRPDSNINNPDMNFYQGIKPFQRRITHHAKTNKEIKLDSPPTCESAVSDPPHSAASDSASCPAP